MKRLKYAIKSVIENMNTISCKRCGCKDFYEIATDRIDWMVVEKDVVCQRCGRVVNSWAYGYYFEPECYTDLLSRPLEFILWFLYWRNVRLWE